MQSRINNFWHWRGSSEPRCSPDSTPRPPSYGTA